MTEGEIDSGKCDNCVTNRYERAREARFKNGAKQAPFLSADFSAPWTDLLTWTGFGTVNTIL